MNKRSQFVSGTLMYALTAVVIILMGTFGFRAMNDMQQNRCETELQMFKADLTSSVASISKNFGEREEKNFLNICDADEIYFLDRKRVQSLGIPEIDSTVASGSLENVFLFGKNRLIDAFHTNSFDIKAPYYECLEIKNKKLGFYLSGTGNGADIEKRYSSIGCSPIVFVPEQNDDIFNRISVIENKTVGFLIEMYNNTGIDPDCSIHHNDKIKIKINSDINFHNVSIYHEIPDCFIDDWDSQNGNKIKKITIKPKNGRSSVLYNSDNPLLRYRLNNGDDDDDDEGDDDDDDEGEDIKIEYKIKDKNWFENLNESCKIELCHVIVIDNSVCRGDTNCSSGYSCSEGECIN